LTATFPRSMAQSSMIVRNGGSSNVRRKLESEDEIIQILDCDLNTFIAISKPLETWTSLDSKRARIQVSVNVDKPLQFERRIEFPNGDIGRIFFSYEGLHRYCFTCHMISHDENACPQLTPEERELKQQQRAELNAQADPPSLTTGTMKRPRSPLNGRHSPNSGRHRISSSNQPQSHYRREEKRQKLSTPRENRAYHPYQKELSKERESSSQGRCLETSRASTPIFLLILLTERYLTSRRTKGLNKQSLTEEGTQIIETRAWRPRSPPTTNPYTDMAPVSSRAPLSAKDAPTRAVLDSQRTISDQLGHLDLGDVNRTEHPKSPLTETAEERLRRIKGKAHITDTPTSRDREPRARKQASNSPASISPRPEASSPGHKNNVPKQLDLDIDLDLGQDPEITLTEDELALVDSMVMET
ncbi:LOW QUALITY PROTEIN: hypothetical protein HID58_067908, partial [Brassica napus]